MEIKSAKFITSAATASQFLTPEKPMIAVCGKSNVGKSSLINMLANHKGLAKTSASPGRTRLVNYFDFGAFWLADLPGYGYAAVGRQEKEKWSRTMSDFFAESGKIRHVLALVDIRHGATEMFDVPSHTGCCVKKESALSLEEGFACIVCFAGGRISPVAFGKCGDKIYDVKKLCAAFEEKENPKGAQSESAAAKKAESPAEGYDDEIVASENYYEYPDADVKNLKIREDTHADTEIAADENARNAGTDPHEGTETAVRADAGKDEDAQSLFRIASAERLREDESACYYERVKKDLDALFEKYPPEETLCRCIPLSKWVKIDFSRGKYYTVGVIFDNKKPRYICYGVPAEKRGEPPEALKGWCSYLPASVFDVDGKGYWMMYQDAETGGCVKMSSV